MCKGGLPGATLPAPGLCFPQSTGGRSAAQGRAGKWDAPVRQHVAAAAARWVPPDSSARLSLRPFLHLLDPQAHVGGTLRPRGPADRGPRPGGLAGIAAPPSSPHGRWRETPGHSIGHVTMWLSGRQTVAPAPPHGSGRPATPPSGQTKPLAPWKSTRRGSGLGIMTCGHPAVGRFGVLV